MCSHEKGGEKEGIPRLGIDNPFDSKGFGAHKINKKVLQQPVQHFSSTFLLAFGGLFGTCDRSFELCQDI
jgi:hypothetical protein